MFQLRPNRTIFGSCSFESSFFARETASFLCAFFPSGVLQGWCFEAKMKKHVVPGQWCFFVLFFRRDFYFLKFWTDPLGMVLGWDFNRPPFFTSHNVFRANVCTNSHLFRCYFFQVKNFKTTKPKVFKSNRLGNFVTPFL